MANVWHLRESNHRNLWLKKTTYFWWLLTHSTCSLCWQCLLQGIRSCCSKHVCLRSAISTSNVAETSNLNLIWLLKKLLVRSPEHEKHERWWRRSKRTFVMTKHKTWRRSVLSLLMKVMYKMDKLMCVEICLFKLPVH